MQTRKDDKREAGLLVEPPPLATVFWYRLGNVEGKLEMLPGESTAIEKNSPCKVQHLHWGRLSHIQTP